jgi:tetratricopeptide (TPR) repeat protein
MAVENRKLAVDANSLVSQVISTWRTGSTPNAQAFLEKNPALRDQHSLVLDLAYEEYCLRREAGEPVVLSTFCDRFPTVRKSLRVLLATHECIEEDGTKGELSTDIPWPEIETLFLGFFLLREIGRGAFARVYLATEPALGDRLVVVKVSRRGESEAETLGRLTHHNIVPVYSVREDPETRLTAICMPYLGSGNLLKALDTVQQPQRAQATGRLFIEIGQQDALVDAIAEEYTQIDPVLQRTSYLDSLVHIAAQLADALAYAHEAGICHRDLKPSNVLLAPSGRPLLLDFNLSSDDRLPHTLIGGTLPYMPPEQLQSVLTDVDKETALGDPRSDIFSLGVILYELLTGQLPFGDQMVQEEANVAAFRIMANQVEGFESLTTVAPDVDTRLQRIVQKCLQLEPDERYQSAMELADQLRAYLAPRAQLQRWIQRRRFLLAATALGGAFIAAAAGARIATRPPYAQRRYREGIRAFKQGNLNEAATCFADAHRAHPAAYEPLFARGQVLVRLERYTDAAEDLQRAYRMAPSGVRAAWAGYASQEGGDRTTPEVFYRKALDLHRYETVCILNNLGRHLLKRKLTSQAISFLSRAIELDPTCQQAYISRATAYSEDVDSSRISNPEEYALFALADVEMAVSLEPTNVQVHLWAALLHNAHNKLPTKSEFVLDHMQAALELGMKREKLFYESGLPHCYAQLLADFRPQVETVKLPSLTIMPPHQFPPLLPD